MTTTVRRPSPATAPLSAGGEGAGAAAGASGSEKPNRLPSPSALSIHNRPPWSSTMRFDKREAEAGSLGARPHAPATPLEGLEDTLAVVVGDSDAGVAHRDLGDVAVPARGHDDRAAGLGELDCVREQVEDDLLELELVGPDGIDGGVGRELQ